MSVATISSLEAGQTYQNPLWFTKGPTNVSSDNLHLFHNKGICSKAMNNKRIFILRSMKLFTPVDVITDDDIKIFNLLGSGYFKTERPSSDDETQSPFSPSFRNMWLDNPLSCGGVNSNPKPGPSSEVDEPIAPPDDPDSDSESEDPNMFSLFD